MMRSRKSERSSQLETARIKGDVLATADAPGRLQSGRARPALEVENISITYDQRTGEPLRVLDRISMSIRRGEFVSILGPSGCGKSTFLRVINALVPPYEGSVKIDGHDVTEPNSEMAVVFQAHSLLPWQTVAENAAFGLRMRGTPAGEALEAAKPLLELVGLNGFEEAYPHELSGGMQQRVNLARALVVDPKILLMDEPFAALDAQTRVVMQKELLRIWDAAERKTVLFVTHNVEEAVFLSDRIIVLTTKPARVREDVEINLPRPREIAVTTTEPFREYVGKVWNLIETYVFKAGPE